MKTNKNNKLNFRRDTVLELNDSHLYHINGGTSPPAGSAIASSAGCASAAVSSSLGCFVATVVLAGGAYIVTQFDDD